ncbi:hypothetical protein ACFXDH_53750, partial [Streptomyces sp. NPDC059467]|uniref:hypothetical protein n=1 Tax=Streptomyces sp. NPDC059467 TaxID=3346844 RepID=UPI0036C8407F
MKLRRLLTPSVAAALAVLGLAGSATSAHAGDGLPDYWAVITTDDHGGVYWQPYDTPANKVGLTDDSNGGSVLIDCWVSAGQVGTAGDVWYRIWKVNYPPPGGHCHRQGHQPVVDLRSVCQRRMALPQPHRAAMPLSLPTSARSSGPCS